MLEELRRVLAAADWPRGLALALEAWRELRTSELAALVDCAGARLAAAPAPENPHHHHAWWIERAARYEPAEVTHLVATARVRVGSSDVTKPAIRERWGDEHPLIATLLGGSPRWFEAVSPNSWLNGIDRLAAVLAWPPDPRATVLLVEALEAATIAAWGTMLDPVCELIADALIELADPRVAARLESLVAHAEKDLTGSVDLLTQSRHAVRARRGLAALAARLPPPDPDLAALAVQLAPPAPPAPPGPYEILPVEPSMSALWAEVAAHPDELGPRIVLGDALVERGDPRGELIALQCGLSRDAAVEDRSRVKARVRQLLEQEWGRWLGPLARFLNRRGCEFHRGMLEVLRVGQSSSPDDGWREVARHHELCAVHTVRPTHVSPGNYSLFLEGLARRPRRLGLHGPEVIEVLLLRLGTLALETVYYSHEGRSRAAQASGPSLAAALASLARLAPDLEVLSFEAGCSPAEVDHLLPRLSSMFSRLRRIEIPRALLPGAGPRQAAALARYRALGIVEVI